MGLGDIPQSVHPPPLTPPKHMCYTPLSLDPTPTLRRNQNTTGKPPRPWRTQRPSPSQRPSRRPAAQANVAISSTQVHGPLPPNSRRWKVHRLHPAGSLLGCHRRDYAPLTRRVYLAGIHLVGEPKPPATGGTGPLCPLATPESSPSVNSVSTTTASGQRSYPPVWSTTAGGRVSPAPRSPSPKRCGDAAG